MNEYERNGTANIFLFTEPYWEDYNRQRFAKIAAMPRKPEYSALWEKLEAQKARRISQKQ